MTRDLVLQFKNRNDQDQVLRLFHDLAIRVESLRGFTRQAASQQPFRSSSVTGSYPSSSTNHPFTSGRSTAPLYQHYSGRSGSSLNNHIVPDERIPSSRARNVYGNDHQPMSSIRHRNETSLSSLPMESSHTYERAHTASTDHQGMGTHFTYSQNRHYAPVLQSTPTTHHRRLQSFSPPVVDLGRAFSPVAESLLLDMIDQPRSRPSSGAAFRDMLPPRRELPFLSGKQAEPTVQKRSQEQSEVLDQGSGSMESSQGKEASQQPTPQTISRPRLSGEQAEKPVQKRVLTVKRKNCDLISKPVTKKQKSDSSKKPVSTSPIQLPTIPSVPFRRKAIVRQTDAPTITTINQNPSHAVQKVNEQLGSKGLVTASSSNTTYPTETFLAKGFEDEDATEAPAEDSSLTLPKEAPEAEGELDSTFVVARPEKISMITDGSNVLPKLTFEKMDQGTQTLPVPSGTSAKDEDIFVAKFQLMWDIRNLQQACFQRLLTATGTSQRMEDTKALEELEQNIIYLCQTAIDRHGLAMCDMPYEKLVNAITRP
ncbi:uncharacterized protein LY79DRAFT_227309 [Colletotrichum navitas]|uniref:Uncharacterized protein n=1 Tax=Colletotrichum navitas TaxID=681940 RepID=A0AAD8PYR0_9PEZI|nr:uncharacterized protein LY79DRAFT_227309 [Colletotrichum navitas]KAK1590019.1 hypothetical protein LY79DRAFT_227309 [Colletotrichum navitas]